MNDGDRELLRVLIEERTRYLETRIENSHTQVSIANAAANQAIAKAEREMERRLEGLNELRQQVVEDRSRFVTRELFDSEMEPLKDLRSKAIIIVAGVATFAGLVGAALMKALG